MDLNLHFQNGKTVALKVPVLNDKELESLFNNKQSALIIHGENMTAMVPRNQLAYIDYQPVPSKQSP